MDNLEGGEVFYPIKLFSEKVARYIENEEAASSPLHKPLTPKDKLIFLKQVGENYIFWHEKYCVMTKFHPTNCKRSWWGEKIQFGYN